MIARGGVDVLHFRFGADVLIVSQVIPQVFKFLDQDGLVPPPGLQPSLVALSPGVFVNDKDVRSQIGNMVSDIKVHTINQRHHDDERNRGNHYPQQGQKGTQLVGSQGFHGDPEGFAGCHPGARAHAWPGS